MRVNSGGTGQIPTTENEMDINALDFESSFDLKNANVGIVGQGFVGSAMKSYFERKINCLTYDKYKPESGTTLDEVVSKSDIIFVCVPTPMRHTGECYTGIVESVLQDIERVAQEIDRPTNTFVVCIKSTVPPGFTARMQEKHSGLRLVFSPEFLTEKNAVGDMLNANRVIVGGTMDDSKVVLRYFLEVDKRRVDEGKCVLVQCSTSAAEMAKLFGNGLLFSKVMFSNEVYVLCQVLGINYEEVRILTSLDPRIGGAHTAVPGPDGFLGAGGHCFPKDMHNLCFTAKQYNVPEKMFSTILARNGEVRQEKDWEKMNDRAVTDK
jgi:UDPglucose 6-dehydrogenase